MTGLEGSQTVVNAPFRAQSFSGLVPSLVMVGWLSLGNSRSTSLGSPRNCRRPIAFCLSTFMGFDAYSRPEEAPPRFPELFPLSDRTDLLHLRRAMRIWPIQPPLLLGSPFVGGGWLTPRPRFVLNHCGFGIARNVGVFVRKFVGREQKGIVAAATVSTARHGCRAWRVG